MDVSPFDMVLSFGVSEWLSLNVNSAIFQLYHGENKLLDQHAQLLKQQFAGRHVTPLGHIILIPSQPVFVLSPYCCVLSGEATNVVFGLTRSVLKPMIYRIRGEHANHYTTDAVLCLLTLSTIQSYNKYNILLNK